MNGFILFSLDLLQFFICHNYIFVFFIFVTLDDIICRHFFSAMAAVFLVLDTGLAFLVKLVKMDIIILCRLIHPDRDQYQPHRDTSFMCNCHIIHLKVFFRYYLRLSSFYTSADKVLLPKRCIFHRESIRGCMNRYTKENSTAKTMPFGFSFFYAFLHTFHESRFSLAVSTAPWDWGYS